MAYNICEFCKNEITPVDEVACPLCDKKYHKWCWSHAEGCISCDQSNHEESIRTDEMTSQSNEFSSEEDDMFTNIGEKIQNIGRLLTVICVILGVIVCIVMAIMDMFLIGLLIGSVIGFISWLSMYILYGFGALISSSQNTEKLLSKLLKEMEK